MRTLLCICFAVLQASDLLAQGQLPIKARIHYIARFYLYEGQKTLQTDEAILDVGDEVSRFYSLNSIRREEIKDSVLARGGQLADVMNAWDKAGYPRTTMHYQVWKNHPEPHTLTYTDRALVLFHYTEQMQKPRWTLLARDSVVAGYPCQQAETLYLGRIWRAWFTLDIPIREGPWKLHGLPGLILQAEESERLFSFSCIQVEKAENQSLGFPDKKHTSCTKEEYHDLMRLCWKDPNAFTERMTGFRGNGQTATGKPLVYPERIAILLEK